VNKNGKRKSLARYNKDYFKSYNNKKVPKLPYEKVNSKMILSKSCLDLNNLLENMMVMQERISGEQGSQNEEEYKLSKWGTPNSEESEEG